MAIENFYNCSLAALDNGYDRITQELSEAAVKSSKKLALEKQRLELMNAFYHRLNGTKPVKDTTKKGTRKSKIIRRLKVGILIFATLIGLCEAGAWTYFGAAEAMTSIAPGIVAAALIPICTVFTTICLLQLQQVK